MADFMFNRAKGRIVEFAERINGNDPANSAFIVLVLATAGIETDAVLRDKDSITDLVSGATSEVTNGGYARKTLDQAAGVSILYDDTNDRVDVDVPDQTWVGVAAGDGFNDVVIGYDSDTTAGTDANIIPCTVQDFVLVPDGSDITAQFNASGWIRAA